MNTPLGARRWLGFFGGITGSLLIVSIVVVLGLSPILAAAYLWTGWHRMADTCDGLRPRSGGVGFSYSTSMSRLGFTCRWDDGHRETKLWW
jgi:hypothetical protein